MAEQCAFEAQPGSILCKRHGGDLPQVRRERAERVTLARLAAFNHILAAVEAAAATYVDVMINGKPGDRLRAADRILELAGIKQGQPVLEVNLNVGLQPDADANDAKLLGIIERMNSERAELLRTRAIEVVSVEVEEQAG